MLSEAEGPTRYLSTVGTFTSTHPQFGEAERSASTEAKQCAAVDEKGILATHKINKSLKFFVFF